MKLNKLSLILTSAVLSSCLCAAEIDLKGKNLYIENREEPVYQICVEAVNSEEKITVNNITDREVCVNFNPDLKFATVNIMPEKSDRNVDFNIKIKEIVTSNIPGLKGQFISSSYLGDKEDKGNIMKLSYKDLDADTVITSPDFSDISSKTSINAYMIDKYINM